MILKTAANMQKHGYIEAGEEGGYYEVDGQRTEIGGGDSRFSTCEVKVLCTLNGEPFVPDSGVAFIMATYNPGIKYSDVGLLYYKCNAYIDPDNNIIKPLLYQGAAIVNEFTADKSGAHYITAAAPTCTGDIHFDQEHGLVINGDGTITFALEVEA